jgi:uncharacterized membrane protein YadS
MEENKTKNKKDSRKFFICIVWIVITLLVMAWCTVVMIITKQVADSLVGLIEKVLTYLFAISMMYLGVNVGQKMGFAFADALSEKYKLKEAEGE